MLMGGKCEERREPASQETDESAHSGALTPAPPAAARPRSRRGDSCARVGLPGRPHSLACEMRLDIRSLANAAVRRF